LEQVSIPWTALGGALLAGGALTVLGQWLSLAWQTRRQRQERRADFQRTTLLQVRDLLGEVAEAMQRVTRRQYGYLELADEWDPLPTVHPEAQAVSNLTFRLRLAAVGLDNDQLQGKLASVEALAWRATIALNEQDSQDALQKLITARNQALDLLGEHLRRLP
jgi:hypothetical protein